MASRTLPGLILCAAVLADYAWRGITLLLVLASALAIVLSGYVTFISGDLRILVVTTIAIIVNIWSQMAFDDSFDGDVADAIEDLGARVLRCPLCA